MDVVSEKNINRLVAAYGTTRLYELDDKTWLSAKDGTVSWRNNNPGNLKLEYAGGANQTAAVRTKDEALSTAKRTYKGVVDLDQHGNMVFENYDAGRSAQKQYIEKRHAEHTVEELIRDYSKPDYSGAVHYDAQARDIHAVAASEGQDLHGKKVKDMSSKEVSALLDGISHFEQWKPGQASPTQVMTDEEVTALKAAHANQHQAPAEHAQPHSAHHRTHKQGDHGEAVGALQTDLAGLGFTARDGSIIRPDQQFGSRTKEAVEAFQQAHGLHVDGIAGKDTLAAIDTAKAQIQTEAKLKAPSLLDAHHPAHGMYEQAYQCVSRLDAEQGRQPGPHTQMLAGSLTAAASTAGFNRIDHVVLNDDASRGWAVQGDLNSPFKRYTDVDVMQAIQTPLQQSSQEAAQHTQTNVQNQQQAQAQQQQATQDVIQQQTLQGPGMGR